MAESLRRILGKGSLSTTPVPENIDQPARPSCSFLPTASGFVEESIKLRDLTVPVPPAPTLQRKTPSREKLNQYRKRLPISTFATSPHADAGPPTPERFDNLRGPPPEPDHHFPRRSTSSAPQLASHTQHRLVAQGCEFNLMAFDEVSEKHKSVESIADAGRRIIGLAPSRIIRSQTRKHHRSDSTHEDDVPDAVDFASAAAFAGNRKDTLQLPALNVRRTPSPLWSNKSNEPQSPSPTTAANPSDWNRNGLQTPSPRAPSTSPPTTASKIPRHMPSAAVHAHPARNPPLINMCKNDNKHSNSRNNSGSPRPSSESPNYFGLGYNGEPRTHATVHVRPPIYDITRSAGQQWEQYGVATSRPEKAWEPAKRWTCCTCGSQTIVEQTVCSRLDCGHDRCPTRCDIRSPYIREGIFGRM